jgi:hypothetical protein
MRRTLFIILAVIAVFLIIGFSFSRFSAGRNATSTQLFSRELSYGMGGGSAPVVEMPAAEAPAPAFDTAESSVGDAYNAAQPQAQERLVIENADLAIVVKDPKTRMAEINNLANELGGYVVSSNLYQSFTSSGKEIPEASIVIRVPADRLDEALNQIKEGAVEIVRENRSGQDVTSQYVDLQSQLKAKQAAEQKLLEIMDQAVRAEDVLAIYLQVQSVQTEIEQLKGQIQYLEESAAMSAISVQLIAEEGTQPIEVGPWRPEGAAREAIQDLILFFQNFVDFLIYLVLSILPALILVAIPLYLVYLLGRAAYRRVRRSKTDVVEVESEEVKKYVQCACHGASGDGPDHV